MPHGGRCHFSPNRDPWERQPNEADVRWEAFVIYRDLGAGKRSCRRVSEVIGKTRRQVAVWCTQDQWFMRCAAYDHHLDREARDAVIAEFKTMAKRHAQAAQAAINVLLMPLQAIAKPRVLVDVHGEPVRNEDGDVVTIDRRTEMERVHTDQLLALAAQTARALSPLVAVERMSRAQGEPDLAPLPHVELPQPSDSDAPRIRASDDTRMAAVLAALQEAGALPAAFDALDARARELGAGPRDTAARAYARAREADPDVELRPLHGRSGPVPHQWDNTDDDPDDE